MAILDADDRMKPDKLALALKALDDHPIVSSALDVLNARYEHLRFVGNGRPPRADPGPLQVRRRCRWIP